jgi:hypothetical protein
MPRTAKKTKKATTSNQKKTAENLPKVLVRSSKLPSVWKLTQTSLTLLWNDRWLFLWIILTYGIVNLAIAQGFSSGLNITSAKNQLSGLFHGHASELSSGVTIYALMLASLGGSSSGGGFGYSLIFTILASLAIIWALRNGINKVKVSLRDAYYRGTYPLIPFLGIILVIALELIPTVIGITLYTTAVNNNIAVTGLEKLGFLVIMLALILLSLYLLSGSIFALYIVTLPDMTPFKALRSARDLVKKRRLAVLLRVLYLPVALLVVSIVITLPFIILASAIAPWVFLILSLIMLAVLHSYLYSLYRELLV